MLPDPWSVSYIDALMQRAGVKNDATTLADVAAIVSTAMTLWMKDVFVDRVDCRTNLLCGLNSHYG